MQGVQDGARLRLRSDQEIESRERAIDERVGDGSSRRRRWRGRRLRVESGAVVRPQTEIMAGQIELNAVGQIVVEGDLRDGRIDGDLQLRLIDLLQRRGVELRQGYGLAEAAPVCLFNRVDRPNVRGTLGYPYPGVDVAIFPPSDYSGAVPTLVDGDPPLPDGIAGEICVRGANVFRGYLHDRETGLPRRGPWLCTGDRGVRNADGTVSFLGLLKPMFTRNGFNIYPRELERAVCEMSGVVRAEVRAVPDPVKEHQIGLRVSGTVSEADVRRWCERRLSAYKQPNVVEIA